MKNPSLGFSPKWHLFVSLFSRNKQLAEAAFAKHPLGGQAAIGYPATRVAGLGRCAQFGFRVAHLPRRGPGNESSIGAFAENLVHFGFVSRNKVPSMVLIYERHHEGFVPLLFLRNKSRHGAAVPLLGVLYETSRQGKFTPSGTSFPALPRASRRSTPPPARPPTARGCCTAPAPGRCPPWRPSPSPPPAGPCRRGPGWGRPPPRRGP